MINKSDIQTKLRDSNLEVFRIIVMLLIIAHHYNSDTMRRWLWQTVLDVKGAFSLNTLMLIMHALLSVLGIFTVCVIIDQIRIRTIERYVLDKAEKGVNKLLMK